jgi:hypothetical protein
VPTVSPVTVAWGLLAFMMEATRVLSPEGNALQENVKAPPLTQARKRGEKRGRNKHHLGQMGGEGGGGVVHSMSGPGT